ncbi:hypothetical protein GCM10022197_06390 [Microlunatus spumicola]|uniref:Uncharacterized protein n=1 Tax=Microlunatus spumicola TaxID=81499 RepID=A0ABP6WPM5_9ACTN
MRGPRPALAALLRQRSAGRQTPAHRDGGPAPRLSPAGPGLLSNEAVCDAPLKVAEREPCERRHAP